MKIQSLHLYDGLMVGDYDLGDMTIVTSVHNRAGKTTLLRCLLYALGYPIPPMRGLSFEKMFFEITILGESGDKMLLKRSNATIELVHCTSGKTDTYSLPTDRNRLHQIIFGIENETVLDNLLGAFYLDQEKVGLF